MAFNKKQIMSLESYLGVKQVWNILDCEKTYIKKVQKYCSVFKYIPGVSLIWIGNSLAMCSAIKNSDIDLFVVTQKNALWFVRVIMTLILMMTGNRTTQRKHAGKICLSFFCTENSLDFSEIAVTDDIYLYYWILTMKPIFVRWTIYEQFLEKNSWVDFKKAHDIHKHHADYLAYNIQKERQNLIVIKYIDMLLKKILLPRSLKKYERLWKPEWVIIHDNMLKFHNKDKRRFIREKVLEKI